MEDIRANNSVGETKNNRTNRLSSRSNSQDWISNKYYS